LEVFIVRQVRHPYALDAIYTTEGEQVMSEREAYQAWLASVCNPAEISPLAAFEAGAARAKPVVPAGYVLVPVEPTPEMLTALMDAFNVWMKEIGDDADIYTAILAAAPKP
jgi:hypothetical protein